MKRISLAMLVLACLLPSASTVFAADGTENHGSEGVEDLKSAICHVCRVHDGENEPEPVVATADYDSQTYGFCSDGCRDKFVEDPVAYLPPVLPRPAPVFQAVDLEGQAFSSESLKGKWILLDFWATWCRPCVVELPNLTALHERYRDRGFAVIGVSIDEGARAAKKVARMIRKRDVTYPVYLDSGESPGWVAYRVRSVPAQFLISPDGDIVAQWAGTIEMEELEAELLKRLEG